MLAEIPHVSLPHIFQELGAGFRAGHTFGVHPCKGSARACNPGLRSMPQFPSMQQGKAPSCAQGFVIPQPCLLVWPHSCQKTPN